MPLKTRRPATVDTASTGTFGGESRLLGGTIVALVSCFFSSDWFGEAGVVA